MVNIYRLVGQRIRALREAERLTQREFAKRLGVAANTVSRWETAAYKVSLEDLRRIAYEFRLQLGQLLPPEADLPQIPIIDSVSYLYLAARDTLFLQHLATLSTKDEK